jgi:cytochrome P450
MTGRVCQEDVELAGQFIPKGTEVAVDVYNLHHNPDVWKDPYVFDPERFTPGGEADNQKGIAWVPFSNGSRQCIGMNFSMAEQRVVLSMLCKLIHFQIIYIITNVFFFFFFFSEKV